MDLSLPVEKQCPQQPRPRPRRACTVADSSPPKELVSTSVMLAKSHRTAENEALARRNANTVGSSITRRACAPTSPRSTASSSPGKKRAVSRARARRRGGSWRPSCHRLLPSGMPRGTTRRRRPTSSHQERRRASTPSITTQAATRPLIVHGREWRQRCHRRQQSSPGNVLCPSMRRARACGAAAMHMHH